MPNIAIIVSKYNSKITFALRDNCVKTLIKKGVPKKNINVFYVPGALESPFMAQRLAKKKKYGAIIVFGCVLKGGTYHFEVVSNASAKGLMDVSLKYDIPIINEILCVYKLEDALDRAFSASKYNRGVEGAVIALAMLNNF